MPLDFKKLIAARFLFTFAVQMQAVVIGWRIYDLTKEPIYLGLVGLVEAVPALSLALFAGLIVDQGRPLIIYRRVLVVSFISGLLVYLVHSVPAFADHQVIALYCSSFLTGVARAFSQPTIYSAVPKILDRDKLPRGAAMSASSMQIARIAGPAIGGIIFGWLGVIAAAATVTVFLLGSAIVISTMTSLGMSNVIEKAQEAANAMTETISEKLFSGVKFVFSHAILLPALLMDMISVMFGGVTALLPIYASEILFVGPKGLGLLRAAPAVGAALMGIYLASRDIGQGAGRILFGVVTGFGVCILIFGISTNFYLSIVALFLAGAFDSVSMIIRSSAVQLVSPENMRGRISAVNAIFIGSSNELGELESGIAAQLMGVVNSVLFGGVVCLLTVAGCAWRFPALRRMNLKELR